MKPWVTLEDLNSFKALLCFSWLSPLISYVNAQRAATKRIQGTDQMRRPQSQLTFDALIDVYSCPGTFPQTYGPIFKTFNTIQCSVSPKFIFRLGSFPQTCFQYVELSLSPGNSVCIFMSYRFREMHHQKKRRFCIYGTSRCLIGPKKSSSSLRDREVDATMSFKCWMRRLLQLASIIKGF